LLTQLIDEHTRILSLTLDSHPQTPLEEGAVGHDFAIVVDEILEDAKFLRSEADLPVAAADTMFIDVNVSLATLSTRSLVVDISPRESAAHPFQTWQALITAKSKREAEQLNNF
jgi:hypothetical protein